MTRRAKVSAHKLALAQPNQGINVLRNKGIEVMVTTKHKRVTGDVKNSPDANT